MGRPFAYLAAMIEQHGTCLQIWDGDRPAAGLTWETTASGWHILSIDVTDARLLVGLLARFRSVWRAGGRPALRFDVADDNAPMQRMLALFGIPRGGGSYGIANLEMVSGPRPRGAVGS